MLGIGVLFVGPELGLKDGVRDGFLLGCSVGVELGALLGAAVVSKLGILKGVELGCSASVGSSVPVTKGES